MPDAQKKGGKQNHVKYRTITFKNHDQSPNNARQADYPRSENHRGTDTPGAFGGVSEQELLEEYPELEKEDFQAVFAYATGLVEEEQVFPVRVSA